ncbi:MAG: hypothetical protein HKN85_04045 [Gammaproteobacteria bacterium]|nr:hypothetical protein [Gammaproteobacteria bacterium]
MNLSLVSAESNLQVDGMSLEEIYSLFEPDPSLPLQITSTFTSLEKQYRQLKLALNLGDADKKAQFSAQFRSSVAKYLKLISRKMYVPLRKRLQIADDPNLAEFHDFEARATETNIKIGRLLQRMDASQIADGTVPGIEVTGVMLLLANQLKAEKSYLFPLYSDSDELAA